VLALFISAGSASATVFTWSLTGGGDTGSGTLVTGPAAGAGFDVLSFSGLIDGNVVALFGGQPGPIGASGPDTIYYDNILYPNSDPGTSNCAGGSAAVDGCGILFAIDGGYGNIFDNYSGTGTGPSVYSTVIASTAYNNFNARFTVSAVPEPWSLSMLAAAAAALALITRRKQKYC